MDEKIEKIKTRIQVYVNHLMSQFRTERKVQFERAKHYSYQCMVKGDGLCVPEVFKAEGKMIAIENILEELEKLNKIVFNITEEKKDVDTERTG